jgi:membrane protein DedA with SNARE-associated domain
MPLGTFTVYTVLGCLPWTFALAAAGYAVGSQWKRVDRFFTPVSIVIGILLVAAIAWWVVRRIRARNRERAAAP